MWQRIVLVGLAIAWVGDSDGLAQTSYVEVEKLLASDGGFVDQFGDTLAIDGDTLVIGGDDIGFGGAYVFERNYGGSNAWGEVIKLTAFDQAEDFGRFVDLQGDLIAVGANDVDAVGSVYLFERNEGGQDNWGLTAKLNPPDGPGSRIFATPAIDGATLAVGALGDDDHVTTGGAVYLFVRDPNGPQGWRFTQKIFASDPGTSARFGEVLDLDKDTLVVGAYNHRVNGQAGAGAAYIFDNRAQGWVETKRLAAPISGTDFGRGVAVEGDVVAVGHPGEEGNTGAVYVYGRDIGGTGSWSLDTRLVASDAETGSLFGISIDLDEGRMLIGADISKDKTNNAGAMYVFERGVDRIWREIARLDSSDAVGPQGFGNAVGLSGATLVAGANADADAGPAAGAAYVFQRVARPGISTTGSCPGTIQFELAGATTSGSVFVARASDPGISDIPEGPCAGTELELSDPRLLSRFVVDDEGSRTLTREVPPAACGQYLQAVDGVTCGAGPVVQLP